MSTVKTRYVALRDGHQLCAPFDSEMEAQMWIDNTPEARGAKVVRMGDPWGKNRLSQPDRADRATLYLLDADGNVIGQTSTGHLLIISEEPDGVRAGILIPSRESGKTSFRSLPDELLVPRLAEAFALLSQEGRGRAMGADKLEFYVNMEAGYSLCNEDSATHIIRTTPNTYSVYLIDDVRRQVPDRAARKVMARVARHLYMRLGAKVALPGQSR